MPRTVSISILGLLVALTGCPSGDDSSTSVADASTGTPMTTGATEMASADTTQGPTTTDTPGTTEEPVTTTEQATTGGTSDACAPEPDDDACGTCVKMSCCPELEACDADASGGCQCFQECAELNPGVAGAMQCATDCMVDPFGMGPTGDITSCTIANCGAGICV